MLAHTRWIGGVGAPRLRAAIHHRRSVLGLGRITTDATAPTSSSAPTNMFVAAHGEADGLRVGERLEVYGQHAVHLISTNAATSSLAEIAPEVVAELLHPHTPGEIILSSPLANNNNNNAVMEDEEVRANHDVSVRDGEQRLATWTLSTAEHQPEDLLLLENGTSWPHVHTTGLRALRGARLAFMALISRLASSSSSSSSSSSLMAIMDLNAHDASFTHVALHTSTELELLPDRVELIFVPLSTRAANAGMLLEEEHGALVRQLHRHQAGAELSINMKHMLQLLPLRHAHLVNLCLVMHLHQQHTPLSPSSSSSSAKSVRGDVLGVAEALSLVHSGGYLLVSFVAAVEKTKDDGTTTTTTSSSSMNDEDERRRLLWRRARVEVGTAVAKSERRASIMDEISATADAPSDFCATILICVH